MSLSERLKSIRKRVEQAAQRSKFAGQNITILGASKGQSINSIRQAAEYGILDMGENYAQELLKKAPLCLDTDIKWHFIGRLQANKIKLILPYAASIASLDSLELGEKIARVASQLDTPRASVPVLLQVNLGSERQKAGLPPSVIEELFDKFQDNSGILLAGLMTLPPAHKDLEKMRPYFSEMKKLFDRLRQRHKKPEYFKVLSMGMSHDFEVAIEEGANCVRIGEALFGPRPKEIEE
ncbi:MAG: YggS family pyridoxal phosphate-dependent enzyme [Deltaproteobacteria bacterium]|nr:YggS family pyridoxal phosphate-dependent enzyme [Deltaproteobacteria bacterium]